MDDSEMDVLAYVNFPTAHRTKLISINPNIRTMLRKKQQLSHL